MWHWVVLLQAMAWQSTRYLPLLHEQCVKPSASARRFAWQPLCSELLAPC
jgi:hypothetical protein